MFTEEDLEVYFHFLAQTGVYLSEEQKRTVITHYGRHPYLLSLLGCHLVKDYANQLGEVDVIHTFQKVEERFIQSYERIIKLVLDSDNRLRKLWQILFDTTASVEQRDVNRMLIYNLIYPSPAWSQHGQENTQPAYVAFSEHFQHYYIPGCLRMQPFLYTKSQNQQIL